MAFNLNWIFFGACLLVSVDSIAQDTLRVYLDRNGFICEKYDAMVCRLLITNPAYDDRVWIEEEWLNGQSIATVYCRCDPAEIDRLKVEPCEKVGSYVGAFKGYYPNGNQAVEFFYNNNGDLEGEQTIWHENGRLNSKVNFVDSLKHGEEVTYDTSGNIQGKLRYTMGRRDGELLVYHPNGKIKQRGQYEDGRATGTFINYFESGQMREKYTYVNGHMDGEHLVYYESGAVEVKKHWKGGKLEGDHLEFYEDGSKRMQEHFENGRCHGPYYYWNRDGELRDQGRCENGSRVREEE